MAWPLPEHTLDHRLLVALLGSALAHAAILGLLAFSDPAPKDSPGPVEHMVEYRPIPAEEEAEPEEEAPAATRSQEATGDDRENREATSPQAGPDGIPAPTLPEPEDTKETERPEQTSAPEQSADSDREPADDRSETEQEEAGAASTDEILTREHAPDPAPSGESSGARSGGDEAQEPEAVQPYPSSRQMARWDRESRERRSAADRNAELARQATREDRAAAYISSWIAKVERVGNLNYPEEARRRNLTGKVRVEAMVRPDGTLEHVRILEPSGSDILDAAAKQIIRLGAPYSAFPEELKRRYGDGLPIRHHFNFTRDSDLTSQ
ncbi:MAG: TonB family protein [Thiohalorhabdus sp.]|uniref:TonB family protein n=1 Tax=Thiohalorhabdus sp. TaxID=3094134 RepID=UPI00398068A4